MDRKPVNELILEAQTAYRLANMDSIICVDSLRFKALQYIPKLITAIIDQELELETFRRSIDT